MFKSLFILGVLLQSVCSTAAPRPHEFNAQEKSFCQSFDFPAYRKRCEAEMQANAFLPDVLDFCRKESFESERFDCLTEKRGLKVDWQAVLFCREFLFRRDRDRCLNKVIGRTFAIGGLDFCRGQDLSESGKLDCLDSIHG